MFRERIIIPSSWLLGDYISKSNVCACAYIYIYICRPFSCSRGQNLDSDDWTLQVGYSFHSTNLYIANLNVIVILSISWKLWMFWNWMVVNSNAERWQVSLNLKHACHFEISVFLKSPIGKSLFLVLNFMRSCWRSHVQVTTTLLLRNNGWKHLRSQ